LLLALKQLKNVREFLEEKVIKKEILKYRITLNLDTTLSLDLVSDKDITDEIEQLGDVKIHVDEIVPIYEYKNSDFYQELFENKVDFSLKKRLTNLSSEFNLSDITIPTVSFYSYKGGVGRTTALTTFANYISYHHGKKVVILDFDFEAPGLINYFDFSLEELDKNGIVEYLLDSESSKKELDLLQNYMVEVSNTYSGEGSIYVMPSGNLFGDGNLESYLEGLSRIDINGTTKIVTQINNMLKHIEKVVSPDIILVDSRTGFNDIFGLLTHHFSTLVIGFFEENIQTQPGIRMFLNEFYKKPSNVDLLLVNSLVHKNDKYLKRFESFKEMTENIIMELSDELISVPMVKLQQQSILSNLGTSQYEKDDYLDFIIESMSNDYKTFFDNIIEIIDTKKSSPISNTNKPISNKEADIIEQKKSLLQKLYDNFPNVYAEGIKYTDTFLENEFFFRKCMEDIFNYDKILLIGGKGTGKTAFYNALKDENFIKNLQKKANKSQQKFNVVDVISLQEDKNKIKYFEVNNFEQNKIEDSEFFYTRFWKIYILNSILIDINKLGYSAQYNEVQNFTNSTENKIYLEQIIYDDNKINLVEQELLSIDKYLKSKDINLLITFDQLDYICKPLLWDKVIAPLIKYCRGNPFSKIIPKLFLRRDLFQKLSNTTNKESVENRTINLEWSKEEIFAFFFKLVFAYAKDDFFNLMNSYGDHSHSIIRQIQEKIKKRNNYNQVPLEEHYLIPLVETFFGKYASVNEQYSDKKYGTTYDWFYKSLMNADGTISLRPFLDLMRFSIDISIKNTISKHMKKPILPAYYFTAKEARNKSVERHFKDLADEEGNEDLRAIIEHIKTDTRFPRKFRQRVLKGKLYDDFLEYVVENIDNKKNNTKDSIEKILKINGIIRVEYIHGNLKKCTFAYLYKYYLGLRG